MSVLQSGDIAGYRPHGVGWLLSPISWAIWKAQGVPVTHTGIVVDPRRRLIVEAWWPKARYRIAEEGATHHWHYYRPIGVTIKMARKAADIAETFVGVDYDIRSICDFIRWFAIERILKIPARNYIQTKGDADKLFCQELITLAYRQAGYDLAEEMGFADPSAITPGDIARATNLFDRVL